MILLIDFDSILYQCTYKIVSFSQMRDAIEKYDKDGAKEWLLSEVINEGTNRCENRLLQIQNYLSEIMPFGQEITGIELFITSCSKSFRKELEPSYKANRKRNKYVDYIRQDYIMNGFVKHSETLEADDLISIRANEIGIGKCVVVSMDKDLKQIGGYYWSYYQQKWKNHLGEFEQDPETGIYIKEYKQKEIELISERKANYLLWKQMLTGDTSDNIKGLYRIGEVKAKKILENTKCYWVRVAREYIARNQKKEFKINYQLLKLKTNY